MSELLKRRKKLSEFETRYYLSQLISALKYLHAHLVIHRDLKLGNLFIDSEMRVKVGDFGLATRLECPEERKKTICGTPNYIAPEILEGKDGHSFEVDVWSSGVIMYTLLIGKPPFEAKDVKSTYKRILGNQYSFPDHTPVCEHAKSLIRQMLQVPPLTSHQDPRGRHHPLTSPLLHLFSLFPAFLQPRAERRPTLEQILDHSFFTRPSAFMPTCLTELALRETPLLSDLLQAKPPSGPHTIIYPSSSHADKGEKAAPPAAVGDENDPHAINRQASARPLSSNLAPLSSLAKKPVAEAVQMPLPAPSARPKTAPAAAVVPSSSSSSSSSSTSSSHAGQPAVMYSQNDADDRRALQSTAAAPVSVRRSSRLGQAPSTLSPALPPPTQPSSQGADLKPVSGGRLGSSRPTAVVGPAEKGYAYKFEIYQDSKAQGPREGAAAAAPPPPRQMRPAADDVDHLGRDLEGIRLEDRPSAAPMPPPAPMQALSGSARHGPGGAVSLAPVHKAPYADSQSAKGTFAWDDETVTHAPLGPAPLGPVQSTPMASSAKDGSKPLDTLETMHQMLNQSFTDIDKATRWVPDTGRSIARVWVVRYVDYTSKYGLGFLLNTGSAGVYFNDSTKIVLSSDGTVFQYIERRRKDSGAASEHVSQTHLMTAYPQELQKKVTLLRHFRNYLVDQHKSQAPAADAGGDLPVDAGQNMPMVLPEGASSGANPDVPLGTSSALYECTEAERTVGLAEEGGDASMPFLKKWVRTRHAILFRLSNRTVQVVFFDRSEVLLSSEARVVTYVNKQGAREEHSLEEVLHTGTHPFEPFLH